jgi:hypothetical protein
VFIHFFKTRQLALALGLTTLSALAMAATASPSKAVAQVNSAFDTPNCSNRSNTNSTGSPAGGCADLAPWSGNPNYQQAVDAESRFLSNLINVSTEDFQTFADGFTPTTLLFNSGPVTITGTLSGTRVIDIANYPGTVQSTSGDITGQGQYGVAPNTRCNPGGSAQACLNSQQTSPPNNVQKFIRTEASQTATTTNFAVDFTAWNGANPLDAVIAFGFYGTDIGDQGGGLSFVVTGSSGSTTTTVLRPVTALNRVNNTEAGFLGCGTNRVPVANPTPNPTSNYYANCNGAVLFYGVVLTGNEVINRVEFRSGGAPSTEFFTFDNFTVGGRRNRIPAPLPLAGLLPLGVAFKSMGKKRKSLLRANPNNDLASSSPT